MAFAYSMVGILSEFLLSGLLVVCLRRFGKWLITLLVYAFVAFSIVKIKPMNGGKKVRPTPTVKVVPSYDAYTMLYEVPSQM